MRLEWRGLTDVQREALARLASVQWRAARHAMELALAQWRAGEPEPAWYVPKLETHAAIHGGTAAALTRAGLSHDNVISPRGLDIMVEIVSIEEVGKLVSRATNAPRALRETPSAWPKLCNLKLCSMRGAKRRGLSQVMRARVDRDLLVIAQAAHDGARATWETSKRQREESEAWRGDGQGVTTCNRNGMSLRARPISETSASFSVWEAGSMVAEATVQATGPSPLVVAQACAEGVVQKLSPQST